MLGRGSLNELDIFPTTQHSSLTKICYIPCRIQQLALTPMAKATGIRHSPPCGGCGKHTSEGRRLSCLLQAYTESSFVVAKSSHHKGWQFVCAWTCVREVDAVHFSSSYCGAKRCWEMMGSGPADSFSPLPPLLYRSGVRRRGGEGLGLIRRAGEQRKTYVHLTRSHLGLGLVRVIYTFRPLPLPP